MKNMDDVWSEHPLVKWSPNRSIYITNLRREIERLRMVHEMNPLNIVEVLEIILTMLQKAVSMPMKASTRIDVDNMTTIASAALYNCTHLKPSHD